jgi:hydroxyisourate hydrolase
VTTHVLDTARGQPAAGVLVRLEVETADGWRLLGEGVTDIDGRVQNLAGDHAAACTYRLTFAVETPFYPEVVVTFRAGPGEHYHVPLLLSPYGYSTYRGS